MNKNNYIGIALNELYRVFDILNDKFFEGKLEVPMLTIQRTSPQGNTMGWFTLDEVWEEKEGEKRKYEINICPEFLGDDIYVVIDTLLHEMVHYYNKINGIRDCAGRRHNKKFKDMAESVGLIVEQSKNCGFGHTSPSDELKSFIDNTIKPNENSFEFFRKLPPKKEKKRRSKKTFKYTCPQCNEVIRGKRDRKIVCGDCRVDFEMEKVSANEED